MNGGRMLARVGACAAMFASAFVLMTASPARAEDIHIALDQAVPVRLAAPIEGVAVGNPNIAGISVQNDHLVFVTGRSYGSTSLTVMGSGDRVLYSGRVTVSPDETGVVMVTRGAASSRLECTPLCRPRPDITDGSSFAATNAQVTGRVHQ